MPLPSQRTRNGRVRDASDDSSAPSPRLASGWRCSPAGGRQTAYEVTPQAGAWLICVTSFSGPDAKELTEGLIEEIRTRHGMAAYSYCRSAEERRKEKERIDRFKQQQAEWIKQAGLPPDTKLRAPSTYRIRDEYAILVGGYKDDEAATKASKQVRKLPPPDEKYMHKHSGPQPTNRAG